jgi:hypothetical protein
MAAAVFLRRYATNGTYLHVGVPKFPKVVQIMSHAGDATETVIGIAFCPPEVDNNSLRAFQKTLMALLGPERHAEILYL